MHWCEIDKVDDYTWRVDCKCGWACNVASFRDAPETYAAHRVKAVLDELEETARNIRERW